MLEQNVVTSTARDGRWLCILQPWILTGVSICLGNCPLETRHRILNIQKLHLQKLVKVGCYIKDTRVSLSFWRFKDILKSILSAMDFRFSALFYVYLERCFIIFLVYSGVLSGQVVKYIKRKLQALTVKGQAFISHIKDELVVSSHRRCWRNTSYPVLLWYSDRAPARSQEGSAVVTYMRYPIRRAQGYWRIFFHAFVHDFFPTDIAVALDFWVVMLFMKRCILESSLSDKTSISLWPQTGDQLIGLVLLLQIFSLMTLFCKMTKTWVFKWLAKGICWIFKLRDRFIWVRMVCKVDYSILALSCFPLS